MCFGKWKPDKGPRWNFAQTDLTDFDNLRSYGLRAAPTYLGVLFNALSPFFLYEVGARRFHRSHLSSQYLVAHRSHLSSQYLFSIAFFVFFLVVHCVLLRAPRKGASSKASKMDGNCLENIKTGMRVGIIPQDRPRLFHTTTLNCSFPSKYVLRSSIPESSSHSQ